MYIMSNYNIPSGSIIAFDSVTEHWDTMQDYDNIPAWCDITFEVYYYKGSMKIEELNYLS